VRVVTSGVPRALGVNGAVAAALCRAQVRAGLRAKPRGAIQNREHANVSEEAYQTRLHLTSSGRRISASFYGVSAPNSLALEAAARCLEQMARSEEQGGQGKLPPVVD